MVAPSLVIVVVTELASEVTLQVGVVLSLLSEEALLEDSQAIRPKAAVRERAKPNFFMFIKNSF